MLQLTFSAYGRPNKGPRGQIPWLVHGPNTVADSVLILEYLINTYGEGKDKIGDVRIKLTPEEEAKKVSVQRINADLTCFMAYFQFVDTESQEQVYKDLFTGKLPPAAAFLASKAIRKKIYERLFLRGNAKLHNDEKLLYAKADIDALATLLGDKPYYGGDSYSIIDAYANANIDNLLNNPYKYRGLKAHAQSKTNLVDYVQRVRSKYFLEK